MVQPGRRRRPPPRGARRRRPPPRPRPGSKRLRRPPPEKPQPKREPQRPPKRESGTFEIRKGRRSGDSSEDLEDDEAPIEQVVLPQSITQEAEDEQFYLRFGAERSADLRGVSKKVVLAQSAGAGGPDRYIRRRRILIAFVVLLAAVGGAAYLYWPQLQDLLER